MKNFKSILRSLTLLFAIILCVSSASAQRSILLATDSGFDPFGFTTKLTEALQKSSIGQRFKAVESNELSKINATKVGDLAVQIVSNEIQCSGSKTVIVTLIFLELDRDRVNSVQKIYIGSSTGTISTLTVDTDVEQYRDIIVNALSNR